MQYVDPFVDDNRCLRYPSIDATGYNDASDCLQNDQRHGGGLEIHVASAWQAVRTDNRIRRACSGAARATPMQYDPTACLTLLQAFNVCTRMVDRKSTRLNSSHLGISYAVFC